MTKSFCPKCDGFTKCKLVDAKSGKDTLRELICLKCHYVLATSVITGKPCAIK